ncbi:helix-turn-helix domain-containing protein [Paracandidimonas soli]|uniref:Excisionase family DNA binding protein n=1 Tax=Paracandidimonas soli TaxID=1917182 RepID=A0A4R3UPX7_9BURK|nr:excisionase family DNA binding protein [Paracandidimonas soli]
MLSVIEASKRLGVSPRTVYDLAAPAGPIPCHRIGRRIIFAEEDIQEYLRSCRYTEIKREVASFLNSTVSLRASGSGLESYFRKRGREPKLTPTTDKKRPDSTPLQLVSNGTSTR